MPPVFRPPPVTPMSNVGKSFFTSNPTKTLYRNPNFNSMPISTITQCLSSMGINLAAACQIIDISSSSTPTEAFTEYSISYEARKFIIQGPRTQFGPKGPIEAHIGVSG
ncbi:P-loop containing nucleoside triphosphatehydrolases superfamily protein [Striga asiatica]|uniref:P-loop containing nucleoside triphosphatehydrolases superfamily protein n=1 Tax=Striga asiatica TaxID=4170 RepID=A0A5A7Q1X5_STRAF|nr:P-loop containing nucleoside triphosphatehydrolases superfamily protein [Striga asiatica]